MSFDPATAILNFGTAVLDKFFTSPEEKQKAKLKLLEMNQAGELKHLEIGMSAILAEANSDDPWTSRARPSFMYVMYIMILFAIPMGILSFFNPPAAIQISNGMKAYLNTIPKEMWGLFGVGYVGYSASRSYDKRNKKE